MSARANVRGKRRAIVVDDSRTMRTILRRALESEGFHVIEAEHGKDALERLAGLRIPDLALVDWNMPEMNGIELIAALRADRNYDRMAVVMVSSETEPEQVQRAFGAGANEYIKKPFTHDALDEKLTILGLKGSAA